MALLPSPLLQIFFKLVNMMGFGNGSGQKGVFVRLSGWVWACMRVCVCVCKCVSVCEGAVFGLGSPQRGPMCCYQPLGLLGLAAEPRNKAVCSFPGRPMNKCLSQSP